MAARPPPTDRSTGVPTASPPPAAGLASALPKLPPLPSGCRAVADEPNSWTPPGNGGKVSTVETGDSGRMVPSNPWKPLFDGTILPLETPIMNG